MGYLLQEKTRARIDRIGRKESVGEIKTEPGPTIREFDGLVDEGLEFGQLFTRST